MLPVYQPFTDVNGAILVSIRAKAVGFVILPAPLIDIAISVDQSTFASSFVIVEVSFVAATILPNHYTLACPFFCPSEPLASILFVFGKTLHFFRFQMHALETLLKLSVIVDKWTLLLPCRSEGRVLC